VASISVPESGLRARYEIRKERRDRRSEGKSTEGDKTARLRESVQRAKAVVSNARELAIKGDIRGAQEKIESGSIELQRVAEATDSLASELPMLRVLASVGTQMAKFIHEITTLLGTTEAVTKAVERIKDDVSLPRGARQELSRLHRALGDLRRTLER
jgi:flagellin-like hook-associated protein FlgL